MLRPGFISAGLLGFVTSFNNVPLSLLLQTPRLPDAATPTMLDYVQQSYDPMVAAASTLVLAATVVVAVVAERTVGFAEIFGGYQPMTDPRRRARRRLPRVRRTSPPSTR